jgi:PAS domain S-box-containing protein
MAGHTADAIVIYRPDGRIDWVNDGFVRMTGYPPEEAVGARRIDLIHGPFTRTAEFTQLAEDLRTQQDTTVEFVTRTRAGVSYWVSMSVRAAVQDGRVVGQVGVERDITERRTAEERARRTLRRAESLGIALRHEKRLLSTVLGTIPHLVWWKNADLRYVGANSAYLSFRGLSSIAEVVGRREDQIEGGAGLGAAVAELESAVLEARESITDHTVTVSPDDGRQRTFLVNVLPHFEGPDFAGVIGIGADVSQVADLERQLAQASRLESIGQLAAGIAHEINTPVQYVSDNTRFVAETFGDVLTGLGEIAELAHGDAGDVAWLRDRVTAVLDRLDLGFVADEVPSALTQSLEGLERVGGIVRAMKDFSHPGHGRADVDLNRVVETTVQVTRNEWKYLAELDLDLAPDVGAVPCFEGELKQVLLNLVVNAAQAIAERRRRETSDAIGRITVQTQRRGDHVVIAVTDDGIGMEESVRARAFDPFFTTKPVGQGTGQGLSLAHDIVVHKHGGRIEIVSAPGQGATFTVHLPTTVPTHLVEPEGNGP